MYGQQFDMIPSYDFQLQLKLMKDTINTSIIFAENANTLFQNMKRSMLQKICCELKEQYKQLYAKTDEDRYNSIKMSLNLVSKEKVTNIDELFMALAFQINTFYKQKLIEPRKSISYFLTCQICLRPVSNHQAGKISHQNKCRQKQKRQNNYDNIGDKRKKKKEIDTQEKYQQRQKEKYYQEKEKEPKENIIFEEDDWKENSIKIKSKKEQLKIKKQSKMQLTEKQRNPRNRSKQAHQLDEQDAAIFQNFDNISFQNNEYYYQDEDNQLLIKNQNQQIMKQQ